jgi:glycosyltransferase involved in cell wall biosynthesis
MASMHIVIGAYLLSGTPSYRQAGVHQYALQLLKNLTGLKDLSGFELTTLISPTAREHGDALRSTSLDVQEVTRTTEKPFSRIFVEQIETPRLLRTMNAGLYHGLGFIAPLRAPCPTVVSMMDLSFITQPQAHKRFNRMYLSWLSRASCRRAKRVIAISAWTKRDLVQHFGVPAERIDVTPLGVNHDHFKPATPDTIAAFKQQHGIGDNSIFYLGSVEPRKNLTRLIEAFAMLHKQAPALNAQLFIGGNLAWKYDEVLASIAQRGLSEHVKLIGRVSDDDLPKWFSACAVMAYPSLYEGFGLPPLEAMACGSPVVTSNVTSLPEVVGDAGIMVTPTDTPAIADALQRVLQDAGLRNDLRHKSLQRAAQFTWQHTAEMTMESYRKASSHF